MCLDECPPADASEREISMAVDRSTNWARSCKDAWGRTDAETDGRKLFGIVQGGRFPDLRRRSAEELQEIGFSGYAIGGVSVGESENEMIEAARMDGASEWEITRHIRLPMIRSLLFLVLIF